MNETKLDSIMRKLQALMERADHPATPPEEADACRQKADALMLKYKIESVLSGGGKANGTEPEWRRMAVSQAGSEFSNYYRHIAGEVVEHVGGLFRTEAEWDQEKLDYNYYLNVVAFPSDLRYAEVLFMSCMLEFGKRLEPKYDANETDAENIYRMRSAGMERGRIGTVVWGQKYLPNEQKAQNRKVTKLFKEECERRGDDASVLLGRGNNMASFRLAYAVGFVNTIRNRLTRMRSNRGAEASGLVLADLSGRVRAAYEEKYPPPKPNPDAKPWENPRDNCDRCKAAKSGYCREHGYLKPRKTRQSVGVRADGYYRGEAAASQVDLGREGTPRTNPSTKKELS